MFGLHTLVKGLLAQPFYVYTDLLNLFHLMLWTKLMSNPEVQNYLLGGFNYSRTHCGCFKGNLC